MVAILIIRPRPFVQIFNPLLIEGSRRNLKKIGQGVSEKLFKGVDGQQTKSDHNSSGGLKNRIQH